MEKPRLRKRATNYHARFCSTVAGPISPTVRPLLSEASAQKSPTPVSRILGSPNFKRKTPYPSTKFHRQLTSTIELRQLNMKTFDQDENTNPRLIDQLVQQITKENSTVSHLSSVLTEIKGIVGLSHTIACYTRIYPKFQQCAFKMLEKARKSAVPFIRFYMFFLIGSCMCHFKNYALTKVYFYECLKSSLECRDHSKFQKQMELKIYKMVTKIFVDTRNYQCAKKFAYNYLRKSWQYDSIEDQLNSYDLIGLVEFYRQNLNLAAFFHSRMSNGITERSDITKLSSLQLQNELSKESFTVGVQAFIENSGRFIQVLKDYFEGLALHEAQKIGLSDKKRNYGEETFSRRFIMHLSRNREVNNFHYSSRTHTFQQSSNQYYFLKPKKSQKLSKDIYQFKQILEAIAKSIFCRISQKLSAQAKFQFDLG